MSMMNDEKVRIKLEKQYLESERQERHARRVRTFFVILFCIIFFILGIIIGYFSNTSKRALTVADKLEEIKEYMTNSWLYSNDYEDLDNTLNDKAYYGMTSFEDDPYTSYMSRQELQEFADSINMSFVGIGVQYSNIDGISTVTRVFKGSPAEQYGVEVGDIIEYVDGVNIRGLESEEIKELVTGEEGTPVTIVVNRVGQELELVIYRGAIETTVYAYDQNDYVILEIMSFGESTSQECIRYLNDYRDYKKLIIDLRDNSGGYQNSVQEVAGLFLGKDQPVMDQIINNGKRTTYNTICYEYYDNFEKIVILTNSYTASAAEVLTICLKEMHPDTTIVGETTYGKGVVQSNFLLSDGQSALKMTSSKWLSPKGVWINGEGIAPDVEVFLDDVFYYYGVGMVEDEVYKIDEVSSAIAFVEEALTFLDYDVARTDGYFDESLFNALKKFQSDRNLEATGILDYDTFKATLSQINKTYNLDKTKDKQLVKAIEIISQ